MEEIYGKYQEMSRRKLAIFTLLVVYRATRSGRYPNVPTPKEPGIGMVFTSPWEIMEPKVLPQTIMQKV